MSTPTAPALFPEPPSTLAPSSSTPDPEAAVVRAARAVLDAYAEWPASGVRPGQQLLALARALREADDAALIPGASLHYGCRVVELGEDGDEWAIAGHVDRRLALSVVRRYLRRDSGLDRDDLADLATATIARQWIVADYTRTEDEDVWAFVGPDADGARPVTLVRS